MPRSSTWSQTSGQTPPPNQRHRSALGADADVAAMPPVDGRQTAAPRHPPETLNVSPPERICISLEELLQGRRRRRSRRLRRAAHRRPKPLPHPDRAAVRAVDPRAAGESRPARYRRRGRYLIWALIVRCFAPLAQPRYRQTTRMLNRFRHNRQNPVNCPFVFVYFRF